MKSDASITFMTDESSKPGARIADGIVWLSFGSGSTRVSVAVTPEQARETAAEILCAIYPETAALAEADAVQVRQ